MSDMSDYLENALLAHLFDKSGGATSLSNVYIGLYTEGPTDAGGGTEVSGGSYARVTSATTGWTLTGSTITNDSDITFPEATVSWGNITHVGIFDASTGTDLLFWKALSSTKTIGVGDQARFQAGDLDITFD